MNGRILVASDGTAGSLGALRIARLLAERDGVPVEVLGVVEPLFLEGVALYQLPEMLLPDEEGATESLRETIRTQLREVGGAAAAWDPVVEVGQVATAVAARAEWDGAALVVTGIGRHGRLDRWIGAETALQVIRLSRVPMLAVKADAASLPRRAVVATDFSEYSREAARAAVEIMADEAEIHLLHAAWIISEKMGDWGRTYEAGARARLEEMAEELESRHGVRVHVSVVGGDPAQQVLDLARQTRAEVIAAGSHGYGYFTRLLTGSVSTRLLRGAPCSMLIAPPSQPSQELRGALEAGERMRERARAVPAGV